MTIWPTLPTSQHKTVTVSLRRHEELLRAVTRARELEIALRLVLIRSVEFDTSFCRLCQNTDVHTEDCVSRLANASLVRPQ